MENKKESFKLKGKSILSSRPNSMRDFLEDQRDTQMQNSPVAQLHNTTKPQKHKSANVQNLNYTKTSNASERDTDKLERIHIQIRKDIADKLIETVYERKREGKKATNRHIIEQALEEYFAK